MPPGPAASKKAGSSTPATPAKHHHAEHDHRNSARLERIHRLVEEDEGQDRNPNVIQRNYRIYNGQLAIAQSENEHRVNRPYSDKPPSKAKFVSTINGLARRAAGRTGGRLCAPIFIRI